MGIYDRDYMRPEPGRRKGPTDKTVKTVALAALGVILFAMAVKVVVKNRSGFTVTNPLERISGE